jgi:protein-disulfide isomerase
MAVGAMVAACRGPGDAGTPDGASATPVAVAVAATATPPGAGRATAAPPGADRATAAPTPTLDPTRAAFYASFRLPSKGDVRAPVTIYEFSDYACPYCAQVATESSQAVDRKYVDTGKVRVLFYDFPIPGHGVTAIVAHEAAHCAGEQDLYWPMHDALFAQHAALAGLASTDEAGARKLVAGIAREIGARPELFAECLASERYRPIIAGLADAALAQGIDTTPTLMIVAADTQDPLAGMVPLDQVEERIDAALVRAAAFTPGAGPARPSATPPP